MGLVSEGLLGIEERDVKCAWLKDIQAQYLLGSTLTMSRRSVRGCSFDRYYFVSYNYYYFTITIVVIIVV